MSSLRLFAGLPPESGIKAEIARFQELVSRSVAAPLRYIESEHLHMTVVFFGNVDEQRLPELDGILREGVALSVEPVGVPSGAGCFPSCRRARGIKLDFDEPGGTMTALNGLLVALFEKRGFMVDARGLSPHLTLARVRGGRTIRIAELPAVPKSLIRPWRFPELILYRSEPGSGGARYFPEGRYRFTTY
jgi:RNA 2',3'-cyclic 3'-phosphodiesterase